MTAALIDVAHRGRVAIVTLRNPPANAMKLELTEEIAAVFKALRQDKALGAVVLTGQGKSFCAGVDLKSVPGFNEADQRRMVNALNGAFYAVYSCPFPVIGAINGHAIAGGLVLALCCDWRIAVNTPFLVGLTEVRVGVPYPVAAMEVTRQELRADVARRLVLFGQNMPSAAAVEAGVFDEAVDADALLERALAKAGEAADLPRAAFVRSKRDLRHSAYEAIEAAIAGAEPLLRGWLSRETVQAAASVLAGKA
jgi:enoyl-CoA hydratase/carnithine racemase